MSSAVTNDVLNRLLILHTRSLPMYLSFAAPYCLRGDERAKETLQHIVADHKNMADRLGKMILDNNGTIQHGEYPMWFTGLNDLGYAYVSRQMIELQKRDIAVIEKCIAQPELDPIARALAEEALGAAKGHLESLQELTRETSATP
jgi:hypothetical protein